MCDAIPYTQRRPIGPSTRTFRTTIAGSAWTNVGPVIQVIGACRIGHR